MMKGSKEGSKKKAKKLDELGVSHFYFQVFPFLQPFLFQIWFFSFWARYFQFLLVPLSLCVCSVLWLPHLTVFAVAVTSLVSYRVAPAATATASGGEALRPPPQPPFSSFRFLGRHPVQNSYNNNNNNNNNHDNKDDDDYYCYYYYYYYYYYNYSYSYSYYYYYYYYYYFYYDYYCYRRNAEKNPKTEAEKIPKLNLHPLYSAYNCTYVCTYIAVHRYSLNYIYIFIVFIIFCLVFVRWTNRVEHRCIYIYMDIHFCILLFNSQYNKFAIIYSHFQQKSDTGLVNTGHLSRQAMQIAELIWMPKLPRRTWWTKRSRFGSVKNWNLKPWGYGMPETNKNNYGIIQPPQKKYTVCKWNMILFIVVEICRGFNYPWKVWSFFLAGRCISM